MERSYDTRSDKVKEQHPKTKRPQRVLLTCNALPFFLQNEFRHTWWRLKISKKATNVITRDWGDAPHAAISCNSCFVGVADAGGCFFDVANMCNIWIIATIRIPRGVQAAWFDRKKMQVWGETQVLKHNINFLDERLGTDIEEYFQLPILPNLLILPRPPLKSLWS